MILTNNIRFWAQQENILASEVPVGLIQPCPQSSCLPTSKSIISFHSKNKWFVIVFHNFLINNLTIWLIWLHIMFMERWDTTQSFSNVWQCFSHLSNWWENCKNSYKNWILAMTFWATSEIAQLITDFLIKPIWQYFFSVLVFSQKAIVGILFLEYFCNEIDMINVAKYW